MNIQHTHAPLSPQTVAAPQPSRAQKVAQKFESFFVFQMLEHMGKGIKTPEIMGGGMAEDTFRAMLNEKIADEISKSSTLGIAPAIEAQIKRYEEMNK